MNKSSVVFLIRENHDQDEAGVFRSSEQRRKVYANVVSATQTEFFQGGRNGLNPAYKITLFAYDYHDEEVLEYEGRRYTVYRTYRTKDGNIELFVELKKGNEDEQTKGE